MAANLPQGSGGDDEELAPLAEINVTPLVDVMLVLLIIFMVAAPLMVSGVPVKLPETAGGASDTPPAKPLVLTLAADGNLYLREEQIPRSALIPRLASLRSDEGESTAYVRADQGVPYGAVMTMLDDISKAGFSKISLLSEVKGR